MNLTQSEREQGVVECRGSERRTGGMRVVVTPRYVREQSDPLSRQWLFAYQIHITNEGEEPARLVSRRWEIVDAHGERENVRGPGVVGQQPRLEPGRGFEYSSFCPLRTNWGTMEGAYRFMTDAGREFEAEVGRFYLVGPDGPPGKRG